jgi:DNA replication protein DnaC
MAEILMGNSNTTHTAIFQSGSYNEAPSEIDRTRNTGITQAIARSSSEDMSQPIAHCANCGEPMQKDIEMLGKLRRFSILCSCRRNGEILEAKCEAQRALQLRIDKFKRYSLMDERFPESTFENWVFRDDNRELYAFCKRYCECWQTMLTSNRGVLFYGDAGNGKTYSSFAIANELYSRGIAVLAISVPRIIKIITDSFNDNGEYGEINILNTLAEASLLILDDLGTEYKTQWTYEKLYSIIDARYRAKKPTIITTNLSIDELRESLRMVDSRRVIYDKSERIYSRLVEMCSLFRVTGESWRIKRGEENKAGLFKELELKTGG